MWNRNRSQISGKSRFRAFTVLALGTAASAYSLFAFTKAFGGHSQAFAAMVVIILTGWVAMLNSVVQLPIPRSVLRVPLSEYRLLRSPWTGVRSFGALLRSTPLRHLGGRVYLADMGRDPLAVIPGIHAAEIVHIWALLCSAPWIAFWGVRGLWMSIVWGLAVHVPLNVYPTLHLRYVSWRIARYVARIQHSKNA